MEKPRVEAGGKTEDVSLREYPKSEGIRVEEDKCWAVVKLGTRERAEEQCCGERGILWTAIKHISEPQGGSGEGCARAGR